MSNLHNLSHNFSAFFKNTTNFATLFSSLVLSVSILSFNLPKVSVSAGVGPEYMIVTHRNGVNIRDKNCKVIEQVGFGEALYRSNDNPVNLTCNIGGQDTLMLNYGTYYGNMDVNSQDMFVAAKFLQEIRSGANGEFTAYNKIKLNSPNGVNLRDEKCQRVMTLPNGTYSENPKDNIAYGDVFMPVIKVCKAGGEFYAMTPFVYQGKAYQVAEVLTKYE